MDDGPLIVSDLKLLEDGEGNGLAIKKKIALCRCGTSENKPFCDGSHRGRGLRAVFGLASLLLPPRKGIRL